MIKFTLALFVSISLLGLTPYGHDASREIDVGLTADLPSPQPVGTSIVWTPVAKDSDPLEYRLRLWHPREGFKTVYDFGPRKRFAWTPINDGRYTVVLSAKNLRGRVTHVSATYMVAPLVEDTPEVAPTDHPLVALYSAPPCEAGNVIKVVFWPQTGGGAVQSTNWKACQEGQTTNFYVAGMRANTLYNMNHVIVHEASGTIVEQGPVLQFTTGTIDLTLPAVTILDVPDPQPNVDEPILFHSNTNLFISWNIPPVATDLSGRVIWYYPETNSTYGDTKTFTRAITGGTLLVLTLDFRGRHYLREVDLAGNVIREVNKNTINQGLGALGHDTVSGIHHEAVRFPNGQTLLLAYVERLLPGVQHPEIDDVLGDMIIALDENWQVAWAWNSFDHLDVNRKAILGDTCHSGGICAALQLADEANDWTHSNTINYSPSDGNLILSVRNQDWIVKIDYQDGTGTGDIVWTLGAEGDFAIEPDDPSLWFSYQHDTQYIGENQIIVYDNGNSRCEPEGTIIPGCTSRGQVLNLDESAMTVTLALNVDLENYSSALGAGQKLSNGNFHFTSGFQPQGMVWLERFASSDEFLPDGTKVYGVETRSWMYRSYRIKSLYEPPLTETAVIP